MRKRYERHGRNFGHASQADACRHAVFVHHQKDAIAAHEKGMDVIVHMPMEPKSGRPEWLGPGAITSSLTDAEVRERVEKAIDDVPYAIGMNNHMGSKVTSDKRIMSIVLDVCRERGLFL